MTFGWEAGVLEEVQPKVVAAAASVSLADSACWRCCMTWSKATLQEPLSAAMPNWNGVIAVVVWGVVWVVVWVVEWVVVWVVVVVAADLCDAKHV